MLFYYLSIKISIFSRTPTASVFPYLEKRAFAFSGCSGAAFSPRAVILTLPENSNIILPSLGKFYGYYAGRYVCEKAELDALNKRGVQVFLYLNKIYRSPRYFYHFQNGPNLCKSSYCYKIYYS